MSSLVKYFAVVLLASQSLALTCYEGEEPGPKLRVVSSPDVFYCITFVKDNKKKYQGISKDSISGYQYNKKFTQCTTDYCNGAAPPAETRIVEGNLVV